LQVGLAHVAAAEENLRKFDFVGINEMYNSSLLLLGHALGTATAPSDFYREREATTRQYAAFKQKLRTNATRAAAIESANKWDVLLYNFTSGLFCHRLRLAGLWDHPMVAKERALSGRCTGPSTYDLGGQRGIADAEGGMLADGGILGLVSRPRGQNKGSKKQESGGGVGAAHDLHAP
jgi:hypothetical protein